MKTNSILALSSLLALVSATPLAKRVLVVETKTEEVTQTIDTTTTIWVEPAAATLHPVAPQQAYQRPAAKAAQHGHGHQFLHTHAAAVAAPSQPPQPVAPAPVPEPSTSSTPAPAPVAAYQPTTSSPAPYVAPSPVAPVVVPQPVAPPVVPKPVAPAPAPLKQAAKSPAQGSSGGSSYRSSSSGGACGTVGGKCSGDITYYDAGLGACGWTNDGTTEDVFALAHGMMGEQSNGNPFCGRMATVKVPGKAPVKAKLVDKCMGCEGQSIDLSHHLFDQLCDEVTGRLHNVEWSFDS